MDQSAEKYKLIEWLISIEDEAIISKLKAVKAEKTSSNKRNYEISDLEKLLIQAGCKDIENGRTMSHEDVMREVKEKYSL